MSNQIEFHFYLDAWLWCRQNGLKFEHEYLTKKNFRTWSLAIAEQM
jgi:peptidoglycan/LPS O-acetylase OafA/YrhL